MQGPLDTKITFFWDVTSYSLVDRYQHFRQICCWPLSTGLFIFQNTTFQRLHSVSVFRYNLLSWAQLIELAPISRHLDQHQDGVYKPSTGQTICESYENINFLKLYTYEALRQRTIMTEIITGEKRYSLWFQQENKFSHFVFWKINRMVFLDKDMKMDNVQQHNICTNAPYSHTF
jgi:hypothetical protein